MYVRWEQDQLRVSHLHLRSSEGLCATLNSKFGEGLCWGVIGVDTLAGLQIKKTHFSQFCAPTASTC